MIIQRGRNTVLLPVIVGFSLFPFLFISFAQASSFNGLPPLEDRDVIIDTLSSEFPSNFEFDSDQSLSFYPYLTNHQAEKSFPYCSTELLFTTHGLSSSMINFSKLARYIVMELPGIKSHQVS